MQHATNRTHAQRIGWSGQIDLLCLLLLALAGYLGPLVLPLDPYGLTDSRLASPQWTAGAWPTFGTDDLGRDLLSRLAYGARCSLTIGFAVVSASAAIGRLLGLLAGTYGGWVDALIMRVTDVVMALPGIVLAIVVVAVLGPGIGNAMAAVTIVALPRFARVVRAVAMLEMKKQYVQAARTCGVSRFRIMGSEVLPNCCGPVLVQATLGFSDAILDIAALGFLGLGARPPMPEWGAMLADARPFIESAPYLVILPGAAIVLTVLSFNLMGDALQQRFDPKGKVK